MAPKLYGNYLSTGLYRVAVVFHEKDAEFEFVEVNLYTGEHKKPEFLALQPFGLIPALKDGDFQLYESRAIVRYIADKYEGQGTPNLYGSTLAERALVEQWLEVENGTFTTIITALLKENLYKPAFYKSPADPKVVAEFTPKLDALLDIYEAHLAKHKYLAGEFVSIADLAHLPVGWLYFNTLGHHEELLGKRKHVAAWWAEISGRDSWAKVTAIADPLFKPLVESAKSLSAKPS